MKRILTVCVLSITTLAAQPVKKAEYRVADGLFTGVCGYYDVQPRDGTWKMRKANFEGNKMKQNTKIAENLMESGRQRREYSRRQRSRQ